MSSTVCLGCLEIHQKMSPNPNDHRRSRVSDENAILRGRASDGSKDDHAFPRSPSSDFVSPMRIFLFVLPQQLDRIIAKFNVSMITNCSWNKSLLDPCPSFPWMYPFEVKHCNSTEQRARHVDAFFILAHWLAIDGKQPTINENPEIISKADVTTDALDPVGN